jgi:CPA2 family monovalent cation:H+ antiporter-2
MESVGFNSILILLTAAVFMVALFRYLHLPQVLAYLGVGILVGPAGFEVIPQSPQTQYLAEFGLVFLMFTIGLEFSLPKMIAMRRMVFGMGGVQVLGTGLLFGMAAWFAGIKPESAIIIGGIFSLSSTAVVMKMLVEQLEQTSRHGHAAFSILLFQDLAVVPLLILIPAFGGDGSQSVLLTLGTVVLKSAVVLVLIIYGGRRLLEPIFHEAAASRSREFFMLTVLLVTLGAAGITHTIGLSLALGAFLAGMMIGETQYRHQVESDILPFRDILLGLFFITVGMRFITHHQDSVDYAVRPNVWNGDRTGLPYRYGVIPMRRVWFRHPGARTKLFHAVRAGFTSCSVRHHHQYDAGAIDRSLQRYIRKKNRTQLHGSA